MNCCCFLSRLSHEEIIQHPHTHTQPHTCGVYTHLSIYRRRVYVYGWKSKVWKHDKRLILKNFVMDAKWARMWIDVKHMYCMYYMCHTVDVCECCVYCGDVCKRCNPLGNAIMMLQKICAECNSRYRERVVSVFVRSFIRVHFICSNFKQFVAKSTQTHTRAHKHWVTI